MHEDPNLSEDTSRRPFTLGTFRSDSLWGSVGEGGRERERGRHRGVCTQLSEVAHDVYGIHDILDALLEVSVSVNGISNNVDNPSIADALEIR